MTAHLTGAERERMKEALAKSYQTGRTIRELSEQYVMSYGKCHALLLEAGVRFRPVGRPRPNLMEGKDS